MWRSCTCQGEGWRNSSVYDIVVLYHCITCVRPVVTSLCYHHIEAETKWPPFCRRHFQVHFLNDNVWIWIKVSLKSVPKSPVNNIPALVWIMAWCRPGDKALSEPFMVSLPTHICYTRPLIVPCQRHNTPYKSKFNDSVWRQLWIMFLWNCTGIDTKNLEVTLAQVIAWWRQATNHYMSHCLSIYFSSYGVFG